MPTTGSLRERIENGAFDCTFAALYPSAAIESARSRWLGAILEFERIYGGGREVVLVSAPGRAEIGGNHTDHQHGRALAAAINLDVICVASKNDDGVIREKSLGHSEIAVSLNDLSPAKKEKNGGTAIIRGIAAWFSQAKKHIGGFDSYSTSDVPKGSGLSSSAAFEVAVGNILSLLYNNGEVTAQQIAFAGRFAENNYFGKPSGVMDQMAASVGSLVEMDFANSENPLISPVHFDFAATGYKLCIVDTKSSHSDLTSEYADITIEMGKVAEFFGNRYLREVPPEYFYEKIADVRASAGDRATLRAMHFFDEDSRVPMQSAALRRGDFPGFLKLVNESGHSSMMLLQNIFATCAPQEQALTLALAISRKVLEGKGAWRIHGGGFAGTIQAFVPNGLLAEYKGAVEAVFGRGSCYVLTIRPVGGIQIV